MQLVGGTDLKGSAIGPETAEMFGIGRNVMSITGMRRIKFSYFLSRKQDAEIRWKILINITTQPNKNLDKSLLLKSCMICNLTKNL